LAGSFAQLAKNAEKKKPLISVSKEPVKNPPLKVYQLGHEALRTPANRIVKVDDAIRKLIKDMLITMYSSKGIGLAAPQVGIQKRLLVIDLTRVLVGPYCTMILSDLGARVIKIEAPETGGFASEIIATINDECFWSLESPVVRISGFDVPYPVGMLETFYVPDEERIRAAVLKSIEKD